MLAVSWRIECYLDAKGNNPVEAFIEALPTDDRASVRARITFIAEIGNRARDPLSKSLGGGLFETTGQSEPDLLLL
jgi:hypothetical protein